ncbi:MAG: MFS transporter [Chloroflexi bacterium]|nr:MFS transporter [Chloroflexota bacterium]
MHLATFSSLRYRDFRFLLGVTFFTSAGTWLQQVTFGWLVFEITESPLITGAALGATSLPYLFLGPVVGVVIDRVDRRLILILNHVVLAVTTTAFAVLVATGLVERWWDPQAPWTAWPFFAFALAYGAAWSVGNPVRHALIATVVPRAALLNAISLNSATFNAARIIGPAIGGLLIASFGPATNFFLQAVMNLLLVAVVVPMRTPHVAVRHGGQEKPSFFADFRAGVGYIFQHPPLPLLLLLAFVPSFFMWPFVQGLMPVFAKEAVETDARGLGLLLASAGVGSLFGVLALASVGEVRRKGALLLSFALFSSLGIVVFSQTSSLPVSAATLAVLGGTQMMYLAFSNTLVQTITADEYRGRVLSLYMLEHGFASAGSFMAGALADRYGSPAAILLAGLAAGTFLGFVSLRFRHLWRLDL